jgi:hypothetical protein
MMWQFMQDWGSFEKYEKPSAYTKVKALKPIKIPNVTANPANQYRLAARGLGSLAIKYILCIRKEHNGILITVYTICATFTKFSLSVSHQRHPFGVMGF